MLRRFIFIALFLLAVKSQVKAQTITAADTTVYTDVDKKPEFAGGEKKFSKFLLKTIKYPARARENNIQGKVEIAFVIEKDGTLTNFHMATSAGSDLDGEALRIMKLSPKWSPGIKGGQLVRASYKVPLTFALTTK